MITKQKDLKEFSLKYFFSQEIINLKYISKQLSINKVYNSLNEYSKNILWVLTCSNGRLRDNILEREINLEFGNQYLLKIEHFNSLKYLIENFIIDYEIIESNYYFYIHEKNLKYLLKLHKKDIIPKKTNREFSKEKHEKKLEVISDFFYFFASLLSLKKINVTNSNTILNSQIIKIKQYYSEKDFINLTEKIPIYIKSLVNCEFIIKDVDSIIINYENIENWNNLSVDEKLIFIFKSNFIDFDNIDNSILKVLKRCKPYIFYDINSFIYFIRKDLITNSDNEYIPTLATIERKVKIFFTKYMLPFNSIIFIKKHSFIIEFAINSIGILMIFDKYRKNRSVINKQPYDKIILNPNFEIYLPKYANFNILLRLISFVEIISFENICRFKLTKQSLIKGLKNHSKNEIIQFLKVNSNNSLPINIEYFIRDIKD